MPVRLLMPRRAGWRRHGGGDTACDGLSGGGPAFAGKLAGKAASKLMSAEGVQQFNGAVMQAFFTGGATAEVPASAARLSRA